MSDLKISQLPAAAALTGAELIELVQGGNNVKSTVGAITGAVPTPAASSIFTGVSGSENWQIMRAAPRNSSIVQSGPVIGAWQSAGSQLLSAPQVTNATFGSCVGNVSSDTNDGLNLGMDWFANSNECRAYRKVTTVPIVGFKMYWEFLLGSTTSGVKSDQTFFVGWAPGTITLGNTVIPSALTDMVGFGKDQGDTNLQFMVNNSAGTATKTNTGITWASIIPVTPNVHLLAVSINCAVDGSLITATFTDLDSGLTYTTTVPNAQAKNITINTAVSPHLYVGTGTSTTGHVVVGTKYAFFDYGFINE